MTDKYSTRQITVAENIPNIHGFRRVLIAWGQQNFRPFPWRTTTDPYQLLVAETMLHRTQASQVLLVYQSFIEQFPDTVRLSRASRKELHRRLYSLGLRHRVDLIRQMAAELVEKFGGKVPESKAHLRTLPGVSDYISSAIRSFAWNLPEPILDTNVVRVIGRIFDLETKDSSRRNPQFKKLAAILLDSKNPRAYNYAILDLADRICTSRSLPDCDNCPVIKWCAFGNRKRRKSSNALTFRNKDKYIGRKSNIK